MYYINGFKCDNTHDTRKEAKRGLEKRIEEEEQCKRAHESSHETGFSVKMDRGHTDKRMWEVEGTDSLQHI